MVKDKLDHIRRNGIYYTPELLARYLVAPLIGQKNLSVFDPAYGEGALLLAAESIFKEKQKNSNHKLDLFGCDIHPLNGLLEHLPQANLQQQDFFDYDDVRKHDVILTNPPYIRHQNQDKDWINALKRMCPQLSFLSNSSDLWAYFVVKSVDHLKRGGAIGAILPWAFVQADYARPLRRWLKDNFGALKLLALNNPYFESADERVILLWAREFGSSTHQIDTSFAKDFNAKIKFHRIELKEWLSNRVVVSAKTNVGDLTQELIRKYKFSRFDHFADTRIGVVTGANDFFIREMEEAKSMYGFKENHLVPILTGTKEIPSYLKNGKKHLKRLVTIDAKNEERFSDFIKEGVDSEFDQRSHSKNRTPWYSIKTGKVPDAFFPYRVGRIPYLAPNEEKIQCTNSIHRVYFKNLSKTKTQWVFVSMLSMYGQLSLSTNAKTYGRGMVKMEPGALASSLVLCREQRTVGSIYRKIIALLAEEKKEEAVRKATEFLNQELNIPKHFQASVEEALMHINKS